MKRRKRRQNRDKEIKKGMFVVADGHMDFASFTESQKQKFLTLHPPVLEEKKRKSQKILTQ